MSDVVQLWGYPGFLAFLVAVKGLTRWQDWLFFIGNTVVEYAFGGFSPLRRFLDVWRGKGMRWELYDSFWLVGNPVWMLAEWSLGLYVSTEEVAILSLMRVVQLALWWRAPALREALAQARSLPSWWERAWGRVRAFHGAPVAPATLTRRALGASWSFGWLGNAWHPRRASDAK